MDYFIKLPEEITLNIFTYLSLKDLINCSTVCKAWKRISYDPILWKLSISLKEKYVVPGALECLLARGITMLDLSKSQVEAPIFKDSEMSFVKSYCKLQHLDLSMATILPKTLSELLSVQVYLRKLKLLSCVINEDCCSYIAQNEFLEELDLSLCEGITVNGLITIARKCTKLQDLNLRSARLEASALTSLLHVLPRSLKKLNLRGHGACFNDEDLKVIAQNCPNLTELDISDAHKISEDSFQVLFQSCKKLSVLHISPSIVSPYFDWHLEYVHNLTHLLICGNVEEGLLSSLKQHLPSVAIFASLVL